jgi:hypothetical protein
LSRMRRKAPVRFLGEGVLVTAPPYPTGPATPPRNNDPTPTSDQPGAPSTSF